MNRDLDPVALKAAIAHLKSGIPFGLSRDVLMSAAIKVYQKTECKPMEAAPIDGRAFEAWDIKREAWISLRHLKDDQDHTRPFLFSEYTTPNCYDAEDSFLTTFLCWREQRKPNWVKV